MKLKNIENKILSLGGCFKTKKVLRTNGESFYHLIGRLRNYTIEFSENSCGFWTALKDGTKYDMGSDYNPSGCLFYERVKDLENFKEIKI